ncbi:Transcriptional activator Myb [Leucoagaricus sp. SymC.cos]|nr:Transcriptional activator Myb [Leucoagaricus sp. SymC.cos]
MLCRERRSWTAKEDQLLREAVAREDPDNPNPSKWHAIAKHVPNRTNKDCRKRWFAKMASDVVKGGWAPEEDERLVKGIERYGTRWSLVASVVQTRNSDQCAKRWTDTLNPAIDRTTWAPESDELLLQAVNEHGKVWTKIVKTYFPGRTGLSAKNRYNSITRFNADPSRARPRRKSPENARYSSERRTESVSSSSSASPATPSAPLPRLIQSPFSSESSLSYDYDSIPWSSSSPSTDDGSIFNSPVHMSSLDIMSDGRSSIPATPPTGTSYQGIDISGVNQTLAGLTESPQLVYSDAAALPADSMYNKASYMNGPTTEPSLVYPGNGELYTNYPQFPTAYSNDLTTQFPVFETLSNHVDPLIGLSWDATTSPLDAKAYNGFKLQSQNDFAVSIPLISGQINVPDLLPSLIFSRYHDFCRLDYVAR